MVGFRLYREAKRHVFLLRLDTLDKRPSEKRICHLCRTFRPHQRCGH